MDPISLILAAANIVPALAKFLGAGPNAQKVADTVGNIATTVAGGGIPPQEAIARIQASTELQQKFQLAVMERMAALDQLYLADIQDARARDTEIRKSGQRNYRADLMFALAVAMIAVMVWMVWKDDTLNEYVKGIVTLVLGRFLGYLDAIYNFEFGTTRGSQNKDETIKNLSKE